MNDPSKAARIEQEMQKRSKAVSFARELYAESEWVLSFLRHHTGALHTPPTDDQLIQWAAKLNRR